VTVGLAAGLAGQGAARAFAGAVAPALPWVMATALVGSALDLGKRVPRLPLLARIMRAGRRAGEKLTPGLRSALLGAVTPLLPCGFLYGALLAAVASGTVLGGAAIMAAFALGTLPALAAVQMHARLLAGHPRALATARRVVPLLAAAALVWRTVHAGGGDGPPHCH
jgi:sulfite exporter TauE/SafE